MIALTCVGDLDLGLCPAAPMGEHVPAAGHLRYVCETRAEGLDRGAGGAPAELHGPAEVAWPSITGDAARLLLDAQVRTGSRLRILLPGGQKFRTD